MRSNEPSSLLQRLLARLRGGERKPARTEVAQSRPFQGVAVLHGVPACAAAMRISEQRMLAKHAPPLPLPNCTMPHKCTCRFLKFNDRRAGMQRRLADVGIATQLFAGPERRAGAGRRHGDR